MNIRAACVVFSMAAGCFYAQAYAGAVGEDVAVKDLTLKSANAINPPPIYLAANAKASAKSTQTANRLGVCMTVEFDRRGFDPTLHATNYMLEYKKKSVEFGQARDGTRVADTVIRILKEPTHGVLEKSEGKYSDDDYIYTPGPSEDKSGNEFYRGLDHFVMSVSAGGQTVQIHYTVSVVDNFRDEKGNVTSECEEPYWKISQSDFNPSTQDSTAWLRSSELSSLIATDRGASTSITLATNTPSLWQTKAGSITQVNGNSIHPPFAINLVATNAYSTRDSEQLTLKYSHPHHNRYSLTRAAPIHTT